MVQDGARIMVLFGHPPELGLQIHVIMGLACRPHCQDDINHEYEVGDVTFQFFDVVPSAHGALRRQTKNTGQGLRVDEHIG